MPGNVQPIYTRVPDIQWGLNVSAANTTKDLTTGTIYPVFTADATNGGFVQRIRFRSLGTNTQTTVARIWINNGLTTVNAANNTLWDEITLTPTTLSETTALATQELPLNIGLPPGYVMYVTLGTGVSAGFDVTVIGGKY